MERSSIHSPGHTDWVSHRHQPCQWAGGWRVLHHLPHHQEAGRKGLRHNSRSPLLEDQHRSGTDNRFHRRKCFAPRPHKVATFAAAHPGYNRNPVPLRPVPVQPIPGSWKSTHHVHTTKRPTKVRDEQRISLLTSFRAASQSHQGM